MFVSLDSAWAKVVQPVTSSGGNNPAEVAAVADPPNRTIRGSYRPPSLPDPISIDKGTATEKSTLHESVSSLDSDQKENESGFGIEHQHSSQLRGQENSAALFSSRRLILGLYEAASQFGYGNGGNYRKVHQAEEVEKFLNL